MAFGSSAEAFSKNFLSTLFGFEDIKDRREAGKLRRQELIDSEAAQRVSQRQAEERIGIDTQRAATEALQVGNLIRHQKTMDDLATAKLDFNTQALKVKDREKVMDLVTKYYGYSTVDAQAAMAFWDSHNGNNGTGIPMPSDAPRPTINVPQEFQGTALGDILGYAQRASVKPNAPATALQLPGSKLLQANAKLKETQAAAAESLMAYRKVEAATKERMMQLTANRWGDDRALKTHIAEMAHEDRQARIRMEDSYKDFERSMQSARLGIEQSRLTLAQRAESVGERQKMSTEAATAYRLKLEADGKVSKARHDLALVNATLNPTLNPAPPPVPAGDKNYPAYVKAKAKYDAAVGYAKGRQPDLENERDYYSGMRDKIEQRYKDMKALAAPNTAVLGSGGKVDKRATDATIKAAVKAAGGHLPGFKESPAGKGSAATNVKPQKKTKTPDDDYHDLAKEFGVHH